MVNFVVGMFIRSNGDNVEMNMKRKNKRRRDDRRNKSPSSIYLSVQMVQALEQKRDGWRRNNVRKGSAPNIEDTTLISGART